MTDPDKPTGEPDEEPTEEPARTEPTLTTDDEAQRDDSVIDPGNS